MEVATTERHWNDTSVPERPELEVLLGTNLDILNSFAIFCCICLMISCNTVRIVTSCRNTFSFTTFQFKSQGWLHDDALWQVTCSMIIFNMQVSILLQIITNDNLKLAPFRPGLACWNLAVFLSKMRFFNIHVPSSDHLWCGIVCVYHKDDVGSNSAANKKGRSCWKPD